MSEQAWEQRAREQLPMTTNNYMAPLQHNITEQFPARYVLREGRRTPAMPQLKISEAPIESSFAARALLYGGRLYLPE